MDPHRSERLVYTAFDASKHSDLLWAMHTDAIAWANACPQLQRPMERKFHEKILAQLGNYLLFAVINKVIQEPDAVNEGTNTPGTLEPIGRITLTAFNVDMAQHRNSEMGIGIIKEHRGQGYGTEAINWALDWAFEYANLHRVGISILEWNTSACKLYNKVGFKEEGRKRESLFKGDKFWDEILMSLLRHEWRELRGTDANTACH